MRVRYLACLIGSGPPGMCRMSQQGILLVTTYRHKQRDSKADGNETPIAAIILPVLASRQGDIPA